MGFDAYENDACKSGKKERRVRTHLFGTYEWLDLKNKDDTVVQNGYMRRPGSSDLPLGWFGDPWMLTTAFENRVL
jgi:hypothetical protein